MNKTILLLTLLLSTPSFAEEFIFDSIRNINYSDLTVKGSLSAIFFKSNNGNESIEEPQISIYCVPEVNKKGKVLSEDYGHISYTKDTGAAPIDSNLVLHHGISFAKCASIFNTMMENTLAGKKSKITSKDDKLFNVY